MVLADILFTYQSAYLSQGYQVEIFSEKKAYHFYGKDKDYKSVLRPDGAIVIGGSLMMIEYENQQKARSLYSKLERYDFYVSNELIRQHPNIEASSKNIVLLFIYNTQRKKENAKKLIQKMITEMQIADNLEIICTTLDIFLNNPSDKSIFEKIKG